MIRQRLPQQLCGAALFFVYCFNFYVRSILYDANPQNLSSKEKYIMNEFWTAIAKLIETIANLGAGAASNGMGYEPTVPEELVK